MPQLIFRGVEKELLVEVGENLVERLAQIMKTPADYFTIERVESEFIGQKYSFCEVGWFDRGQEVKDQTAQAITEVFRGKGLNGIDTVFTTYKPEDYYENGSHF